VAYTPNQTNAAIAYIWSRRPDVVRYLVEDLKADTPEKKYTAMFQWLRENKSLYGTDDPVDVAMKSLNWMPPAPNPVVDPYLPGHSDPSAPPPVVDPADPTLPGPPGPPGPITPPGSTESPFTRGLDYAYLADLLSKPNGEENVAERLLSNYEASAGTRLNSPYRTYLGTRTGDINSLLGLRSAATGDAPGSEGIIRGIGDALNINRTGGMSDLEGGARGYLNSAYDLFDDPDAGLSASAKAFKGDNAAQANALRTVMMSSLAPTLRGSYARLVDEGWKKYQTQGGGDAQMATYLQLAKQLGLF
jgi:hypothetical protein